MYRDCRRIVVRAIAARPLDLLGRAARGLTAKSADRAIINLSRYAADNVRQVEYQILYPQPRVPPFSLSRNILPALTRR